MNIEERIARLEGFMNKFEEERIRSEERTRVEIELAEARLKKMRRMWEFFKVVLSPIIAAVVTAIVMQYIQKRKSEYAKAARGLRPGGFFIGIHQQGGLWETF